MFLAIIEFCAQVLKLDPNQRFSRRAFPSKFFSKIVSKSMGNRSKNLQKSATKREKDAKKRRRATRRAKKASRDLPRPPKEGLGREFGCPGCPKAPRCHANPAGLILTQGHQKSIKSTKLQKCLPGPIFRRFLRPRGSILARFGTPPEVDFDVIYGRFWDAFFALIG